MLTKLSKVTIAIIFDEKCANCSESAKIKECFIPFLTDSDRIRLCLKLALFGIFYNALQPLGLSGLITAEIFASIAALHDDFVKWRLTNCKHDKKINKEKVDSYVT